MKRLLRKQDVIKAVGLAKSTVSDWITEFQIYIPTQKQGAVTYYLPETIDVIEAIKKLREEDYSKPDIMRTLGEKGFPITIEEAVEDSLTGPGGNYRDNFLKMMSMMGEGIREIGEQSEQIKSHDHQIKKHDQRIVDLYQMLEEVQKELAATKEEMHKPKWYQFWKQ